MSKLQILVLVGAVLLTLSGAFGILRDYTAWLDWLNFTAGAVLTAVIGIAWSGHVEAQRELQGAPAIWPGRPVVAGFGVSDLAEERSGPSLFSQYDAPRASASPMLACLRPIGEYS